MVCSNTNTNMERNKLSSIKAILSHSETIEMWWAIIIIVFPSKYFLYSSIYQTLLEDPRIREIESIQFEGQADALYFQITYISKIGEKITMGGQI